MRSRIRSRAFAGQPSFWKSSVAGSDLELTELIRDEADRIRALVDRMEMFGEKPVARTAVNIHRILGHVRRLAQSGFAPRVRFQEVYDPSLPRSGAAAISSSRRS